MNLLCAEQTDESMSIYVCTNMPLWHTPLCILMHPYASLCFFIFHSTWQQISAALVLHSGPMPIHLCRAKAEQRSSLRIGSKSCERAFFSKFDYVLLENSLLMSDDISVIIFASAALASVFWAQNIFFQNYGGDCLWQALPHGSSTHKNAKGIKKIQKVGNDSSGSGTWN